MFKRLLAIAAVLTLAAAACGDDDDDAATPAETTRPPVEADDPAEPDTEPAGDEVTVEVTMSFEPATVEIDAGTAVRWVNSGGLPHTVTSTSGPMDFDEPLPDGGTVILTFDEPGTYEYACTIHPGMTGTIVVS
jgi:plastocyanin